MPVEVLDAGLGTGVRAGFTTRAGGTSAGPWEALNLALHVDDDPRRVHANRELLAAWVGDVVHFAHQVHGGDVLLVEDGVGDDEHRIGHDGLVTARPGVALGVLVADCVPLLLADPVAGVVGAAHAGRRGLVAGVVENTVAAMTRLGASVERIAAAMGPAAGGCCYELPAQLRDEVEQFVPGSAATTTWATASVDLRAGVAATLDRLGVATVNTIGGCTIEDQRFYSYRRDRVTGRFAGVVRITVP